MTTNIMPPSKVALSTFARFMEKTNIVALFSGRLGSVNERKCVYGHITHVREIEIKDNELQRQREIILRDDNIKD